jgi:predicted AlkP superfamily pyrophosphatase or phosphodiesterase
MRRRNPRARTAQLFWRFCTHSKCDITVTERPTYWADGRKGSDIYTEPESLRDELVDRLGEFPLFRFWGPATSIDSTRWIADATLHVLAHHRPDLVLTYLPHLDYDLQKFGPSGPASEQALADVDREAGRLIDYASSGGYDVAILSEYGMTRVETPVYLNRVLRSEGWLRIQRARNGELLEAGASKAFAVCSHQVAHVYVANRSDIQPIKQLLESTPGVEKVLDAEQQQQVGLDHPRSGELVAVAEENSWFAYPYWLDDRDAPDFAHCIAIHDKPGHDPAEMFLRSGLLQGKLRLYWRLMQKSLQIRSPFDIVDLDASRIKGSHGRLPDRAEDRPVLLTSWELKTDAEHLPMTDVRSLLLDR